MKIINNFTCLAEPNHHEIMKKPNLCKNFSTLLPLIASAGNIVHPNFQLLLDTSIKQIIFLFNAFPDQSLNSLFVCTSHYLIKRRTQAFHSLKVQVLDSEWHWRFAERAENR